ncbi:MAG TPA: nickel-responsive transcriptional regulator NikR [Planctomycetota bacterium]|nr:nickel-responsive transcriptional regulator NikR [Planctomycetota bacterium]HRR80723.1 nickel-responsive transcriptional regulator NikR [Planctomycetota bacterium]HRT96795.1 nickel-responsive transcriptional regulator NikR [Planctomycetota bacterium]
MGELVRFGVSLEEPLLRDFDRLIEEKGYPSRSEALRDLIRDYLVQADWSKLSGEQVATLTLVYNHEYRELTDKLTDLQHDAHGLVVCATHVHLTAHTCLEVIVLRGPAADLVRIADKLVATRGVQHGKLTMTTLGRAR